MATKPIHDRNVPDFNPTGYFYLTALRLPEEYVLPIAQDMGRWFRTHDMPAGTPKWGSDFLLIEIESVYDADSFRTIVIDYLLDVHHLFLEDYTLDLFDAVPIVPPGSILELRAAYARVPIDRIWQIFTYLSDFLAHIGADHGQPVRGKDFFFVEANWPMLPSQPTFKEELETYLSDMGLEPEEYILETYDGNSMLPHELPKSGPTAKE